MNFVFPSNATLTDVLQEKLPVLTMDDPLFNEIMPFDNQKTHVVMWEQKDNFKGLMAIRGLDGQPSRVSRVGMKQYQAIPGVYGEFIALTETDLTMPRKAGTWSDAIDLNDAVARDQDYLLNRAIDRIRKIGWDLLVNGVYSVLDGAGVVKASDTFPIQTFTGAVAWSNLATATPLADLRNLKLKQRGKGATFGRKAKLYMNSQTVNYMLSNTNTADLGGKRSIMNGTQISPPTLADLNRFFADSDLPQIVEYDEVYIDEAGALQLFIPNGKAVLVGARTTGETVMKFVMTLNANNEGFEPGMYNKVDHDPKKTPIRVETHMGFNGAPAIEFPGSIVSCNF